MENMRDGQFLLDFDTQRQQLLEDLKEASGSFVRGYDKRTEGLKITDSVHTTLMAGAGLNLASLGLISILIKTALVGAAGVLSSGE